ncbi:MAG: 3-dehydroquinate synthase [Pseudomonadota bacterium]
MTEPSSIDLDLDHRSYSIHIGKGLLEKTPELIPFDCSDRQIFILYDENTYPYAQVIEEAMAGHCANTKMKSMKGGEKTKSYDGLSEVTEWLLENSVNRNSVLVALGGGVIGDLGGFAASVILRGIDYVQIPTTLLAQIDSSVGGKTGINTPQGKNLVGSFYQPKTVICDVGTLGTLPDREFKAGYAEMVKYGLINNPDFFEWLNSQNDNLLNTKNDALIKAIEISCQSKSNVVAADETEKGQRALLNLGHTFGHALEAACKYDGRLLHGEAIAIGMVLAFELSVKMEICPQEDLQKVIAHFERYDIKTRIAQIHPQITQTSDELIELMYKDKKAMGDKIGFIIVDGIGKAHQSFDVKMDDVKYVIEQSLS